MKQEDKRTELQLSRRDVVFRGGSLAAALATLPHALVSDAYAQSETFDYYIGPNGSEQNPGTLSQPWSINALNTKRATYAGKRVGVLDGTYRLITLLGQPKGTWTTNALLIAGGSASSPTIVKSVNRWGAVLDGEKSILTSSAEQGLIGPGGDYVTIEGFEIRNANYQVVACFGHSHMTLQGCYIHDQFFTVGSGTGKNSSTIYCTDTVGTVIRNNRVERGGAPADDGRHNFILFYGSEDCIVEYNTLTNVSSSGGNLLMFKTATSASRRHTVRYNYFDHSTSTNSQCDAILWWGNDQTDGVEAVHHNIIVAQSGRAPIRFGLRGTKDTLSIYNNTLVGGSWSSDGGIVGVGLGPPIKLNVYNNVFTRTAVGSQGDVSTGGMSSIGTMDYNLYDSSPSLVITGPSGARWVGLAAWRAASGKDLGSREVTDPLFAGTGTEAERYRLTPGSPGKAMGSGGSEIGAWAGTAQVGASASVAAILSPQPPVLSVR